MALIAFRSQELQTAPRELMEFEPPTTELLNVPVRGPARGVIAVLSALIVTLSAIAYFVPINRIVSSPGMVVSRQRTVVVEALETSVVRSVMVRDGEFVHAGQVLATLDPTFAGSDDTMYAKQASSLQAWVDRLHAELSRQEYRPKVATADTLLQQALFAQRKAAFDFQVQQYDQKIAALSGAGAAERLRHGAIPKRPRGRDRTGEEAARARAVAGRQPD